MWKRKQEWVPWYRARNYKGNLAEAEKRQLDAFRTQPKHPAATFDDLPEEVQDYLSGMQVELYDKKQEGAVARALLYSHRCRATLSQLQKLLRCTQSLGEFGSRAALGVCVVGVLAAVA